MTIDQALGILKPEYPTLEALKKAYKVYMLHYHPDRNPNGLELCKLGNAANDLLMKTLEIWTKTDYVNSSDPEYHIDEELDRIYQQIRHYAGINIALAGVWLWITDETPGSMYAIKDTLKDLGFSWCRKKKSWSWKPADCKKRYSKKSWDFDEIYGKYGKTTLETEERVNLA